MSHEPLFKLVVKLLAWFCLCACFSFWSIRGHRGEERLRVSHEALFKLVVKLFACFSLGFYVDWFSLKFRVEVFLLRV